MGSENQKFFFLHLHKTGGTALSRAMRHHFTPTQIYPGPAEAGVPHVSISVRELVDRWPDRRSEVSLVVGHFPLCTRELLGDRFTVLTVLRNPLDRVMSSLRKQQQSRPDLAHLTLEEIYTRPQHKVMLQNHMVKMLALTPETMTSGMLTRLDFDQGHLDRAKEQLQTLDVVGFQDDLPNIRQRLTERFGLRLGPNEMANRSAPAEVPDSLRDRIVEENDLDIQLYEFAKQLHLTDTARGRT